MGYPDMKRFARPYRTYHGKEWIWHRADKATLCTAFSNWPDGQPDLKNGPAASAQILAKPYAVISVGQNSTDSVCWLASRTFLVMITDDISNGGDNDYTKEWQHISTASASNVAQFSQIKPKVFEQMRLFNNKFKIVVPDSNAETSVGGFGSYRIMWHEVIPSEHPSLYSVTNLPSPLPIKKVKGGYNLDLDVQSINDVYRIKCLNIISQSGDTLISTPSAKGSFHIPGSMLANGDYIDIDMSLILDDGLYNGMLLTPENPRYSSGLSNRQIVKLSDDARVFGILPLWDIFWWWFPNNAYAAVMLWDIILSIILTCLILWVGYIIFKRLGTYIPADDKIKIKHL